MCDHFSEDGRMFEFCIDTGTPVSLVSDECRLAFFEHCQPIPMANNRRLRCGGIGSGELFSREYMEPNINMRTLTGDNLIISGEVHVVPTLPCGMILAPTY